MPDYLVHLTVNDWPLQVRVDGARCAFTAQAKACNQVAAEYSAGAVVVPVKVEPLPNPLGVAK